MSTNALKTVVITMAVILIFLLGGVGWFIYRDFIADDDSTAEAANATAVAAVQETAVSANNAAATVVAQATADAAAPTATPMIIVLTPTPLPTAAATNTPLPTNTPIATNTPAPTETPAPTNTSVPIVYPTATPVPPTATSTPSGPPPAPPAGVHNGLRGTHFALQDRSAYNPGGMIWFEFNIANDTGGDVPYSTIGVMPRKNGQDIPGWYQNSWGFNNDAMPPSGLTWEDHIVIPEAGDYTLRLVVCFDSYDSCRNGNTFHSLSQEIPVKIQ